MAFGVAFQSVAYLLGLLASLAAERNFSLPLSYSLGGKCWPELSSETSSGMARGRKLEDKVKKSD